MARVKLRNHTVTRGYLAGWKSEDKQGKSGIWYFDINKREAIFSPSLKATFAINKFIYSPKYTGERRDDRLENWFAEFESELCEFALKYSTSRPKQVKTKFVKKALSACVSMGVRSSHSIREVEKIIALQNPALSNEEIKIRALNNCYSMAQENIKRFIKGTIHIFQNIKEPLLTNDHPFWDMSPRMQDFPIACFALTPNTLMVFCPESESKAEGFRIVVQDSAAHNFLINFARRAAMRMARDWVVCPNEEEARNVAAYLTEETLREASSTDRHLYFEAEGEARRMFQT